MLELHAFSHWTELFAKSKLLAAENQLIRVICPSPVIADSVRTQLLEVGPKNIKVETISRFINDLVASQTTLQGMNLQVKRKSELMIELYAVFKKKFSTQKNSSLNFNRLFKLFTEVRGITSEPALLEEFLATMNPKEAEVLHYFLQYLLIMKFYDEHEIYRVLTVHGELRPDNPQVLIFHEYRHLSGQQIDFLKTLANHNDVIVTAPLPLVLQSEPTDWIAWLGFKPVQMVESMPSIKVAHYNRGELGKFVRAVEKKYVKASSIILATPTQEWESIEALPVVGETFKAPIDLFLQAKTKWQSVIEQLFHDPSKVVDSDDVVEAIQKLQLLSISKKQFADFKYFKLWQDTLNSWLAYGEEFNNITMPDLLMLMEKVDLDLPRVNIVGMQTTSKVEIGPLSFKPSSSNGVSIVVGDPDTFAQSSELQDLSNAWELLAAVGPLHSKQLEIAAKQQSLLSLLQHEQAILLLEKGMEQHDASWSQFLKMVHPQYIEVETVNAIEKKDPLKLSAKEDRFPSQYRYSPSSMQLYWDCPRKYFYSAIAKAKTQCPNLGDISMAQRGEIEHALIQNYFTVKKPFNDFLEAKLAEIVSREHLFKTDLEMNSIRLEIRDHAQNGIELVNRLLKVYPHSMLQFEKEYQRQPYFGRADLVIGSKDGQQFKGIFDFKRSDAGIPTKKEMLNFEKIQLWYYLRREEKRPDVIGYFNLKRPENSIVYVLPSENMEAVMQAFSDQGKKIVKLYPLENFDELIQTYYTLEESIRAQLEQDKSFLAKPRTPGACDYCDMITVCNKGAFHE